MRFRRHGVTWRSTPRSRCACTDLKHRGCATGHRPQGFCKFHRNLGSILRGVNQMINARGHPGVDAESRRARASPGAGRSDHRGPGASASRPAPEDLVPKDNGSARRSAQVGLRTMLLFGANPDAAPRERSERIPRRPDSGDIIDDARGIADDQDRNIHCPNPSIVANGTCAAGTGHSAFGWHGKSFARSSSVGRRRPDDPAPQSKASPRKSLSIFVPRAKVSPKGR